jgi:nucleotide-binding universal stress UspA family protein
MRPVIVVGVRDRRSLPTLVWAADDAAARGGEVVAVHAYPPPVAVPELGFDPCPVDDGPWLHDLVDQEWCPALRVRGVPYRVVVMAGPAPAVLREVAAHEHAALLVVGRGRRRRWLRRPMARLLADASPCPVAVVPAMGEAVPSWLFPVASLPHGNAVMTSWP